MSDKIVNMFSELFQVLVTCSNELFPETFSRMLPRDSLLSENSFANKRRKYFCSRSESKI